LLLFKKKQKTSNEVCSPDSLVADETILGIVACYFLINIFTRGYFAVVDKFPSIYIGAFLLESIYHIVHKDGSESKNANAHQGR
jgi:hypothetical protein